MAGPRSAGYLPHGSRWWCSHERKMKRLPYSAYPLITLIRKTSKILSSVLDRENLMIRTRYCILDHEGTSFLFLINSPFHTLSSACDVAYCSPKVSTIFLFSMTFVLMLWNKFSIFHVRWQILKLETAEESACACACHEMRIGWGTKNADRPGWL